MYEGAEEVQRLEAFFDEILMSNRLTLEGLRGVFIFLVLYDHFHNPRTFPSIAFQADNYLFMMMSGITTSLQLRETPMFVKKSVTVITNAGDKRSVKEGDGLYVLKGRRDFNIIPFILSRMVGLYPILWLAIICDTPIKLKFSSTQKFKTKATCQVLHLVALNSLYRPACQIYGPNYVLYASLLFCVCIFYGIIRIFWVKFQNHVMEWASEDIDPVTLKARASVVKGDLNIEALVLFVLWSILECISYLYFTKPLLITLSECL